MSNYSKSTNFATKDNLTPGDPLKIVRGTEIDTEYNNIATAIATKTDNSSAAIAGGTINGTTIGATTASTGAFTTISATGAITSTLATGTAPLVVASTTKVANLNVDSLDGADWASPAALGSTTPASVSATTLSASGNVTFSGGTANGVAYLNGSKVVTSGSALTFDGTNLGLGVTPSAWASGTYKAFQIFGGGAVSGSSGQVNFSQNFVGESGGEKYIATAAASSYSQVAGSHQWFTAPSGTAGNAITFTQAMTLNASGNLGVGDTSPPAPGGADARVISLKGTKYPQYIYKATDAAANSTMWRTIARDTLEFQIQTVNDAFSTEQTAYEILRTTGSNSIDIQRWYTATSERMRLDNSGNLLVGCTSLPASNRTKGFSAQSNLSGGIQVYQSSSNSDWAINATSGSCINFYSDNGSALVLAGQITVNGSVTTYGSISDYRLKENVQPMTGALAKVQALNPVTFAFKDSGQESQGFIAHELQAVIPDAVTGEKNAVDADGKPVYQGVDTSFLVATLTAAIKEQQAIIESLKARLDAANL
jgi:hypothetical protein